MVCDNKDYKLKVIISRRKRSALVGKMLCYTKK